MLRSFLIFVLVLVIFSLAETYAQAGRIDPTFNIIDQGFGINDGPNNSVETIAVQPDGKIIVRGFFTSYNGTSVYRIARLNTDGSLDNSFNTGTWTENIIRPIVLQPDGKIIIGGNIRLNSDGSLDISFNTGTGVNNIVQTNTLQPDGKLIIGGNFTSFNGTAINRIARLNTDGSLDISFNPGSGANNFFVNKILLQPDGKIIIGGDFTTYNGTPRNRIARLNSDGSLDTSFGPGTGADNTIFTAILQPDGKLIIGGGFTSYNGTPRNRIARLNADGSLDTSFNPGTGADNSVTSSTIQPDGKIVIGGFFTSYNGASRNHIARMNSDGSHDTSFNPGTGADNTSVSMVVLQSDGRILVGGPFTTFNNTVQASLVRLLPNGAIDTSFGSVNTFGANRRISSIIRQPDGKILIGGLFGGFNGVFRNGIARLNADGSLDTTFDPGSGALNVSTILLQPDGKIIIGGNFNTYNGTSRNRIARLNATGSLDTSFDPGTGANNSISTSILQPDGKIIIVGAFTSYNGTARNRMARLNADGSLDSSFDPGTGANNTISTSILQPDGKIMIGGAFTSFNGTAINRNARLNTDGSLDISFNPGTGANNSIITMLLQTDGKIIIGGNFNTYNGTSRNRIARLNADGSLDTAFDPVTGADNSVSAITLQSNEKIIIGGSFTSYNGITRNRIARLNADGSLDSFFNPGSGADNIIFTVALQNDDKLITGGDFFSYNGFGRNRIARIFLVSPILEASADAAALLNGGTIAYTPSEVGNQIQKDIIIRNTGDQEMIISSINVTGDFSLVNAPPATVAIGASATIPIRFTPSAEGLRTGTMTINSDSSIPMFTINLSGSGISPLAIIDLTVNTIVQANGSLVTYASTNVGGNSTTNFVIANSGNGIMNISNIQATGDYTIFGVPPNSVAVGGNVTVPVRFAPTAAGTRTGTFTINSDASIPVFTINLTGTGFITTPAIEIKTEGTANPAGSNVQFSNTGVGIAYLKELEITNTGTAQLVITNIQATGDFSFTGSLPPPIDPGNSVFLSIRFAPTNLGERTGTLTILSNGVVPVFTLNLVGRGDAEPEVYNVVTANQNGKHDFLNIRNITLFPNNLVSIFDRWGNKVFEKTNYDNVNGTFNGRSDGGKDLPDGTYYYVIDKNNGSNRITGFLMLRR